MPLGRAPRLGGSQGEKSAGVQIPHVALASSGFLLPYRSWLEKLCPFNACSSGGERGRARADGVWLRILCRTRGTRVIWGLTHVFSVEPLDAWERGLRPLVIAFGVDRGFAFAADAVRCAFEHLGQAPGSVRSGWLF
jgi:hypothetical protein